MDKLLIKLIVVYLFITLVSYILASIGSCSFHPFHWAQDAKAAVGAVQFGIITMFLIIYSTENI